MPALEWARLRRKEGRLAVNFLTLRRAFACFTVAVNAQAPQTEKNLSMKMALMIIEGALEQCPADLSYMRN
jgi:hypothetical protein